MSSIGKLFLVLNLVLAAIFVGSAANLIGTSQEYRQLYEDEVEARANDSRELTETVGRLEAELARANSEADRLRSQTQQLDGQLKAVEQDLVDERQKNADLRESLTSIEAKLSNLEGTNRSQASRITELQRQAETLRDERDGALDERDAAVAASTAAQEAQRVAEGRLTEVSSTLDAVRDRAESAEAQLLAAARVYGFDPSGLTGAPPALDGVVLSTAYEGGAPIVMINLGRRDNVQPGFTFDVFSGSVYKGQIKVEVVNESTSAATISLPGNARVQRGDRVSTRL